MCNDIEMREQIDERIAELQDPSIEQRFKEIADSLGRYTDKAFALSGLCRGTGKGGEVLGEEVCFGLAEHFDDIAGQFLRTVEMVEALETRVISKKPTTGAEA